MATSTVSNESLKQLFDEYGDRICSISMNNAKVIYIRYGKPGSDEYITKDDIEFVEIAGIDFIKITRTSHTQGLTPVKMVSFSPTVMCEGVTIADVEPVMKKVTKPDGTVEEVEQFYRIDPRRLG